MNPVVHEGGHLGLDLHEGSVEGCEVCDPRRDFDQWVDVALAACVVLAALLIVGEFVFIAGSLIARLV